MKNLFRWIFVIIISCCITMGVFCYYSTRSIFYKPVFDQGTAFPSVFIQQNITGNLDQSKRVIPSRISDNKYFPVVYEKCTHIPKAPAGTTWAEEEYLQEPVVTNVLEMADGKRSKIWIEGNDVVQVGDSVHAILQLFDGFGNPRITGGDLVHVWVKEPSKGASCNTKVIDHQNGSYSAFITAFWVGRPQIKAAIMQPREVIVASFKRRYMCPPYLLNTAVFQHPKNKMIKEYTPCNYDPQVNGYPDICNLTELNYGSPWYCGKPNNVHLKCQHWTMASDRLLWVEGIEQKHTSNLTLEMLKRKYKAISIPTKLTFTVDPGIDNEQRYIASDKCNNINWKKTWSRLEPSGYLYNRKWNNRHCATHTSAYNLTSCVQDTHIILLGDSTTRQIFTSLEKMLPCTWITESWSKAGKHSPAVCVNRKWNYTISWKTHQLPFCTVDNPIRNLKSVTAYLKEVSGTSKTILLIHMFGHFLNHHSHVFFKTLQTAKRGIINFLNKNRNTFIFIKGPHSFSFDTKKDNFNLWNSAEKYADIYSKIIHEEFKDVSDRVIYLDVFDITVSTEQWFIHPEDYIVDELSLNIFGYVCSY